MFSFPRTLICIIVTVVVVVLVLGAAAGVLAWHFTREKLDESAGGPYHQQAFAVDNKKSPGGIGPRRFPPPLGVQNTARSLKI